jgi:hypothetical protein
LSYIGRKPTIGNFQICDAISVVNGQAAYTMQVGGVNVSPQSANHMIVSLNGTIQKPNSSFTVSGSTITFASNLATGDVIDFIQILGDVLDLGVPSDATVSTAKLADNAVTAAKITDATITAAKLASGTVQNQSAFKNILINGDMSVNQRGTVTGINSNTYTLDRWITEGDDATLTVSQDTSVPSAQGFGKSLKIAVTTANASVAADELQKIVQRIEGQFLQQLLFGTSSAKSFTLSFWVKSNITGTYAMEFQNDDNDKVQTATYSISSADTWEKKTITISGDTASGFDNDANRSFRVIWWLAAGSNYTSNSASSGAWIARSSNINSIAYGHAVNVTSSTSNTFYLTGCQLEVGTSASDFEFLPTDVNLQRCYRYYEVIVSGNTKVIAPAITYTASTAAGIINFKTTKRATPTLDAVTGSDYYEFFRNGGTPEYSSFAIGDASVNLCYISGNSASSTTAGYAGYLQTNNASSFIAFDSEL